MEAESVERRRDRERAEMDAVFDLFDGPFDNNLSPESNSLGTVSSILVIIIRALMAVIGTQQGRNNTSKCSKYFQETHTTRTPSKKNI